MLQKINKHSLQLASKYTTQDMEICSSRNRDLKSLTCVVYLYIPFSTTLILTVPLKVKYEQIFLLFQSFLHLFHNPLK